MKDTVIVVGLAALNISTNIALADPSFAGERVQYTLDSTPRCR